MALKTITINDATEYSFTSELKNNLEKLVNDLKEFKSSGGNINLPIQVGAIPNERNNSNSFNLFPKPAYLFIELNNNISENNSTFHNYRDFIREKLKEVFLLQYDDINSLFKFTLENNIVKFEKPISKIELGAICSIFPEECANFLQNLTIQTEQWYLQDEQNKANTLQKRGLNRSLFNENYINNSLQIEFHEYPYVGKNKFTLGGEYTSANTISVLSLAGFTFLSHVNFLKESNYNYFYKNDDIINKWITNDQDKIINNIIKTFNSEQTKFYEHFLFEKMEHNISIQFKYLLEKNNVISIPQYISKEEYIKINPDVNTKFIKSYLDEANEQYIAYIIKIRTAIENEDFDFLNKNLPLLNLDDYNKFLNDNPSLYRSHSFFPLNIKLDTIKFLEKFNIFPFTSNEDTNLFLLPLSLKQSNITYEYLLYNPEAQKPTYLTSITDSIISDIKENLNDISDIDTEQDLHERLKPLINFYKDCILPNILNNNMKEIFFNFDRYSYFLHDKNLVSSFLNIIHKNFGEEQTYNAMNIFIAKMGDNPKLLTGLKTFVKNNPTYNLSDNRLATTFYNNIYTNSFLIKLQKDIQYDINGQLKDSVVWWNISNAEKLFNVNVKNKPNFNATNIHNQTITDNYLSKAIKNQKELMMKLSENDFDFENTDIIKEFNKNDNIFYTFDHLITSSKDILLDNEFIISNNYCTYDDIPDIVHFINMSIENTFTKSKYYKYQNNFIQTLKNTSKSMGSEEFFLKSGLLNIISNTKDTNSTFNNFQFIFSQCLHSPFSKIVEKTNWTDILPFIFNSLPNDEEKNRFFKNLCISFSIVDSNPYIKVNLEKWASLFENHKNYDINFDLFTTKIISQASINQIYFNKPILDALDISKKEKKVNHYLNSNLSLSQFENNIFNHIFSVDSERINPTIDLIPTLYRSSNFNIYCNYNIKLNIAELIDIVSLQYISNPSIVNNSQQEHKKQVQEISNLFNKYIYAQELGAKLINKSNSNTPNSRKKI